MKIHTVALVAALCFSSQAFAEVSLTTGAGYAKNLQKLSQRLPEIKSLKTSAVISAK